ncbi:MAG: hypothetical protein JO079_12495, partial [Frankiaceae bacterium]|nr:hypothetical protein [Frankiaceae bacterium]
MRALAICLDVVAVLVLVHTIVNAMLLRRPPAGSDDIDEPVSLLVPMRDEALRAERCIRALLAQRGLRDVEFVVYDDGST